MKEVEMKLAEVHSDLDYEDVLILRPETFRDVLSSMGLRRRANARLVYQKFSRRQNYYLRMPLGAVLYQDTSL
ncbi:hypothetical protein [Haloterrigena salinisoli]|uniref:hypothetical protein n=1 Tax=Haloterrigena salinisoli TaxID=3132747 RepID=UPI0030D0817C